MQFLPRTICDLRATQAAPAGIAGGRAKVRPGGPRAPSHAAGAAEWDARRTYLEMQPVPYRDSPIRPGLPQVANELNADEAVTQAVSIRPQRM